MGGFKSCVRQVKLTAGFHSKSLLGTACIDKNSITQDQYFYRIEKIKFLRPLLPQIEVLHRWMFPAWFAASSAKVFYTIEPEVLLLPLLVLPDSVAIDDGAHYGAYVWHLLKLAGRVEAFEPNPVLAKFL